MLLRFFSAVLAASVSTTAVAGCPSSFDPWAIPSEWGKKVGTLYQTMPEGIFEASNTSLLGERVSYVILEGGNKWSVFYRIADYRVSSPSPLPPSLKNTFLRSYPKAVCSGKRELCRYDHEGARDGGLMGAVLLGEYPRNLNYEGPATNLIAGESIDQKSMPLFVVCRYYSQELEDE